MQDPVLRWPTLRRPTDILFYAVSILLVADVLIPEIFRDGKSKDYALWYWAGQQVLQGLPLYERMTRDTLDFIYPPLSAVLLAPPAWFGKITLYSCLSLLNVAAWWITAQLSNAMTGLGKTPNPWIAALPGVVTITSVFDMFDLGQPNLVLLAMTLYGFWVLRERPWTAGAMFALATAIKAFPIAVFPYLLWRRQWTAFASMVIFLVAFLFVLPAPIRGFERNVAEVKIWYQGMVGSTSEQGFGQRGDQNWSWINQSIIAVTHRLVRPINYNIEDPSKPARTMNVIDVGYKTANWIVLAVSAALGLGFLAIMPGEKKRTPRSDAEELGILFCLMTVATPLARQYYFVWLFFPITVLIHRAVYDERPGARMRTWIALGIAAVLGLLSLQLFPNVLQAWGNNLWATAVLAAALVWHIRHPLGAAGPDAGTALKPAP
ncbi:MAG: glycosyltransferase family 87 protein [Bradyrhizobium guangdongense]|jgi:hypothetical protein